RPEVRRRRAAQRLRGVLVLRGAGRAVAGRRLGDCRPSRPLPGVRRRHGAVGARAHGEGRVMEVLRALGQTIVKMFAADLWLSLGAVAAVAACGLGLSLGVLPAAWVPFVLLAAILATLGGGIVRRSTPKR